MIVEIKDSGLKMEMSSNLLQELRWKKKFMQVINCKTVHSMSLYELLLLDFKSSLIAEEFCQL